MCVDLLLRRQSSEVPRVSAPSDLHMLSRPWNGHGTDVQRKEDVWAGTFGSSYLKTKSRLSMPCGVSTLHEQRSHVRVDHGANRAAPCPLAMRAIHAPHFLFCNGGKMPVLPAAQYQVAFHLPSGVRDVHGRCGVMINCV